ncbi:hypothetical protein LLY42_05765 [Pseudomonas frederiksbergensis]|nr:hypothetical protein LLY42_05765 [Pseudomonas frederiksbergensis]
MEMVRFFSCVCVVVSIIGFSSQPALAKDLQTIEQMHPPVVASVGEQKITVFFLKNTLKGQTTGAYVPNGEVFYATMSATKPELTYVAPVIGEQIVSVFFFERKFPERAGKSLYVLTKNKESARFEGYSYSTLELPLIKGGDQLSLRFFRGDPPDPELQDCRDGRDLEGGQILSVLTRMRRVLKSVWQTWMQRLLRIQNWNMASARSRAKSVVTRPMLLVPRTSFQRFSQSFPSAQTCKKPSSNSR